MNLDNNLKKIDLKNIPPTKDLIERGFVPKNGKIDILFIFHQLLQEGMDVKALETLAVTLYH